MALGMERWKNQVAVVTGASAGIGAAIVEQLAEAGLKVVGLARRKEKVEELAKKLQGKPGKVYAVQADITKEEDILAAFKWIKDNLGPVHILVNNAGVSRITTLTEGETKFWREVLETNVMGLCIATREAAKNMKANNVAGHIVHMNSVLGHTLSNLPDLNMYPATKFAITALTETLRLELNSIGSKIKISSISPGLVATEIFEATVKASNVKESPNGDAFKAAPILQSSDVADAVMYILSTPPHVQSVPGKRLAKTHPILQSEDDADEVMYILSTPPHVQVHELTIKPVEEAH